MNNIINPYSSSRTHIQERTKSKNDAEDERIPSESNKIDPNKLITNSAEIKTAPNESLGESHPLPLQPASKVTEVEEPAVSRFINTLDGALDNKEELSIQTDRAITPAALPGLSADEQQMIYRYFPESPSLELRLYKQDMSTNRVTPRSVGSRVDIRG